MSRCLLTPQSVCCITFFLGEISCAKHAGTLQIVYIDGSHYPQDVLTDAVMAWKLLNEGGIMILDGALISTAVLNCCIKKLFASSSCVADYEWHQVTQVPVDQTPKKAIDAFLHVFVEVMISVLCRLSSRQSCMHC